MIKFEVVERFINSAFKIQLPKRQTKYAAAYDFCAAQSISIPPLKDKTDTKPTLIPTGIKIKMPGDICLIINNRSSGPKRGLVLANGVGIIDADYYNNEDNDGEIFFAFYNINDTTTFIQQGERIGQGYFQQVIYCDDDKPEGRKRESGYGSTGA